MAIILPEGGRHEGANEYRSDCPSCGGKLKFYWNYVKEVGHCWVCEAKVRGIKSYKRLFHSATFSADTVTLFSRTCEKESVPLDMYPAGLSHLASRYLESRRVPPKTYNKAGVMYSQARESLYIPLQPCCRSVPISYQTRKIYAGSSFWRNLRGYDVGDYVFGPVNNSRRCVLVEGVFDLLTPQLWGLGHALLGSKISTEQLCFMAENYDHIVLWLDPDYAGVKGKVKIQRLLEKWGVRVSCKKSKMDPGSYYDNEELRKMRTWLHG